MNRKLLLGAVLASALIGVLVYFTRSSRVPSGQRPLEILTAENIGDLEKSFNEANGEVRLLLLLSPT